MKQLLPLAVLMVLVSCNGNSGSKNNTDKIISKYEASLAFKRGIVSNEVDKGTTVDIKMNDQMTSFSLDLKQVNRKEKRIILKVDGDDVYTYVETNEDGETSKEVVLEKSNPVKDLKEVLDTKQGYISGDQLILKVSSGVEEHEISAETDTIMISTFNVNASINLNNPHCSSVADISQTTQLKNAGVLGKKVATSEHQITTCGPVLSDEQLKQIDLSNIEFCDDRNEESDESNCEVKDMSFLTADL